jgi:hypothetical protein
MNALRRLKLNPWREISILMLILMEVCWVTPWFRSLTAATYAVDPLRVFIVIAVIVMIAHLLVRFMDYLHLKKGVRRTSMVIFILIAIFVGIKTMLYPRQNMALLDLLNRPLASFADLRNLIPAEFIVIVTVLVAAWRGLSIAQSHIGPSSVMNHFWVGIIMYVLFIFFNTLITGESPAEFFYLFLFTSLIAMCTARMTVIGMLRGGRLNQINRFWLLGMLLAASLVVGISALLGGFAGNQFSWIGSFILGIFGGTLILFWIILSPVLSILISLLEKLFNSQLMKNIGNSFSNLDKLIQGLGRNVLDLFGQNPLSKFIERYGPIIKTVIFVGIIIALIFGLVTWMAIRLWRDRSRRQIGAEQKSPLEAGNFLEKLLGLLRDGFAGMISSLTQLTDFNRRQRLRAAARIRQVYADLMELCETLGHPRLDAETPLEFLPALSQLFPDLQPETIAITEAYNYVRYGQLPETRQEVDEIEQAWQKIHAAGREIVASRKLPKKK